jgi:hypothetical protein
MRYRCRCQKCRTRKTLSMKPVDYLKPPPCPSCGSRKWTIDKYRHRKELGSRLTCYCGGYPFMHRIKSGYCYHNPKMTENTYNG